MQKLHAWEKSGSQIMAKNGSVFFNHQYLTNRLISDFDFWNVDRHEQQEVGISTGFLKNFRLGKWAHFVSEIAHPHNSIVRIF